VGLFVPPRVARELQQETRRREAEALKSLKLRDLWHEYNARLDRIVPGMRLMWCEETITLDAFTQGGLPAHWHLVWPGYNGGPLTVQPLVLRDGEPHIGGEGDFIEPGSWMFDRIAEMDMWNERTMRERRRIREAAKEAAARRREQERAAFDRECLEHWLAASRTQISMNRNTPWSQNAAGARAAKAAARETKR